MISAASYHFRLPAIVFKITSCTFIIRSISADEICPLGITLQDSIRLERTFHVLLEPDNSNANNTSNIVP